MKTLEEFDDFDDEVEKWSMKEFFYILQITGSLLYMKGKWIYISIITISFGHLLLLFGSLQLLIAAIVNLKDEFSLALLGFHGVSGCVLVSIIFFLYKIRRREMIQCLTILYRGFNYTYYNAKKVQIWIEGAKRYRSNVIYGFAGLFTLLALDGLFFNDKINKLQGKEIIEPYVGNVYMLVGIPCWFPFRLEEPYAYIVFILYTSLVNCILLSWLFNCIFFTVVILTKINIELKRLIDSIEQIEERSLKRCIDKYGGYTSNCIDMEMLYKDKNFLNEYYNNLKENFQHHRIILSAYSYMNEIMKWPMFFATFNISIGMACGVVALLEDDVRLSAILVSIMLLKTEFFAVSLICYRGQEMIDLGEELFSSFYKQRWLILPQNIKKLLIIFHEKTKKPIAYDAGGMYRIDWIYFGMIVNMAYSYCTILFTMK